MLWNAVPYQASVRGNDQIKFRPGDAQYLVLVGTLLQARPVRKRDVL
jgi:hypothetical protein